MSLHILDAYSVIELETLVLADKKVILYAALTAEVVAGRLTFPDAVLAECRELGEGEVATIWLIGVAGSRHQATFPGSTPMTLLAKVPDLLIEDDPGEQSQIAVACLAAAKAEAGFGPTVVSEDAGLGGDRISLDEACATLAIPCIDLRTYLDGLGLTTCLS